MQDNPIIAAINSQTGQDVIGGLNALGGAFATYQEGEALADANEADAKAYAIEARFLKLRAAQEEVIRRQELGKTLATQAATVAARGLSLDSASFQAIQTDSARQAGADIRTIRLSGLAEAMRALGLAQRSRFEGEVASRVGLTGAFGILADYASARAKIGTVASRPVKVPIPPPRPPR